VALSNAERQRRHRLRKRAEDEQRLAKMQRLSRSHPERWKVAVNELVTIQQYYRRWLERASEPWSLDGSKLNLMAKLEAIDRLDLTPLQNISFPLGYGRD